MRHIAFAIVMLSALPAHAHHPMGGAAPETLFQGLLGGLAHPVIGTDHLAMIVLVGLAAASAGRLLAGPFMFIAATMMGTMVHLAGVTLPLAEAVILASVIAVGALLVMGRSLGGTLALAGFAVAGLFHGWAYGAAVIGAEPMPIASYLAGFGLIQLAIALGTARVAMLLASRPNGFVHARIAAAVCLGVGLAVAAETLEAVLLAA